VAGGRSHPRPLRRRDGLDASHPLADAATHSNEQRAKVGRPAFDAGAEFGWNRDRGPYLTRERAEAREQAEECLEIYAPAFAVRRLGAAPQPKLAPAWRGGHSLSGTGQERVAP